MNPKILIADDEEAPREHLRRLLAGAWSDPGRRGPWSVRVEANGTLRLEPLPLARLRWRTSRPSASSTSACPA